jgi:hypothetical protein
VRSLCAALVVWLVLVFVIDAVLLAAVVALAPPPPEEVGVHGHSELHAPASDEPSAVHDPATRGGEASGSRMARSLPWLMALGPVDLYRLVALEASPHLRARFATGVPGAEGARVWPPIVIGWLAWLAAPPLVGLRRFRRAALL